MNLKASIHLCLVLAIAVSALIRPPGIMMAVEDETIVYVLCTGGEMKTVTVLLDDGSEHADKWCDIYALLSSALPIFASDVAATRLQASWFIETTPGQRHTALAGWPPFSSRAPPPVG